MNVEGDGACVRRTTCCWLIRSWRSSALLAVASLWKYACMRGMGAKQSTENEPFRFGASEMENN